MAKKDEGVQLGLTTKERGGIQLGDVVKDDISGYEGVTISRSEWLHNCPRFLVQSQEVKDGKPVDAISFDEPSLILVKRGHLEVTPVVRPKELVALGDEVKDKLTGLEGVAIGWTVWTNGCSRINIQPRTLKDGVPVISTTVDEKDCEILKRAKPEPKPVTGGPRPQASQGRVASRR